MTRIFRSIIMCPEHEEQCNFRPISASIKWMSLTFQPNISDVSCRKFQVYCFVYVNRQGRLYLHFVGNGMVRPYLRRRAVSDKLYRHTAGHERSGSGLGTISFLTFVKEDGIRPVQCVLFVYRLRTE